jgi:hypothetical protein
MEDDGEGGAQKKPCPHCTGVRPYTLYSRLDKHYRKYHGAPKEGEKPKIQCLQCGDSIYWPTATYYTHLIATGHHLNQQPSAATPIVDNATVQQEDDELHSRGVAGRARTVYHDPENQLLPPPSEFFPFSNATEALLFMWHHVTHPSQACYRLLRKIVRHSLFRPEDFVKETTLRNRRESLPLLPMYEVIFENEPGAPPLLMHRAADWLQQLVTSDIYGPFPTSLGGSKYFATFNDSFSRRTVVSFLKTKDEYFEKYKTFEAAATTETDCKIEVFRCDPAGVYGNSRIKT